MEEIIRQIIIDQHIGELSDDIFVNIDGYLKNKSGKLLKGELEKKIRDQHGIADVPIYAFFCYSIKIQDNHNYIFVSSIFREGVAFSVFNNDEKLSIGYIAWKDIKKVIFVEAERLIGYSNAYIITSDPTFDLYKTYDSQRLYLQDNSYIIIPCLYFGNYNVVDFLNRLVSNYTIFYHENDSYNKGEMSYSNYPKNNNCYKKAIPCKGEIVDYDTNIFKNNIYKAPIYKEKTTNYKENIPKNIDLMDIGELSKLEQYFLDYLKNSTNTPIDESIASLYGISFERAQQLKQYFDGNLN